MKKTAKKIDVSTLAALQEYLQRNKVELKISRMGREWEARLTPAGADEDGFVPSATGFGKTLLDAVRDAINELETTVKDEFPDDFRGGKARRARDVGGLATAVAKLTR